MPLSLISKEEASSENCNLCNRLAESSATSCFIGKNEPSPTVRFSVINCNFLTLLDCKNQARQINDLQSELRRITLFLQCPFGLWLKRLDPVFSPFPLALHFSDGLFFWARCHGEIGQTFYRGNKPHRAPCSMAALGSSWRTFAGLLVRVTPEKWPVFWATRPRYQCSKRMAYSVAGAQ